MHRKSLKGQSSIEFILLIAGVLFFLIIFLVFLQILSFDKIKQKKESEMKFIGLTLSNEIKMAYFSNEGYQRKFSIPVNSPYNISLIAGLLYIKSEGSAMAFPIYPLNGTLNQGENIIYKRNGTVHLNE